jgi:peptidoglycan/LPS O-acetylase OafA/YrhL
MLLPRIRVQALKVMIPMAAAVYAVLIVKAQFLTGNANGGAIRTFMFLYGSALYLWRDKAPMSPAALVALPAILVLASVNQTVFFLAYAAFLAPLVLHLAYLPGGRVRRFNGWGDFSYGVYIYAFPIQQTLVWLTPGLSLGAMVALSCLITLAVAVLSWNLVERPALARKEDFAAATSRAFQLGLAKVAAAVR